MLKVCMWFTCFDNGWLVAGADRQYFEDSRRCPQQLLVGVGTHDTHKFTRTTTRQDDQLDGNNTNSMIVLQTKTYCVSSVQEVHVPHT